MSVGTARFWWLVGCFFLPFMEGFFLLLFGWLMLVLLVVVVGGGIMVLFAGDDHFENWRDLCRY